MRTFIFTATELELMLKRMHLMHWRVYWRAEKYDLDNIDLGPYVNNDARFTAAMQAVAAGLETDDIPANVLKRVYEMAWTAYDCSITMGRSEEEARRAAVIFGQIALDKFLQVDSTGYVMDTEELVKLSRLWLIEGRA